MAKPRTVLRGFVFPKTHRRARAWWRSAAAPARSTQALLEAGADVTVLEIDRDLVAMLRAREDLAAAHVVEADAINCSTTDAFAGEAPWRVAGNLPYNIATPLIMALVEMEPRSAIAHGHDP